MMMAAPRKALNPFEDWLFVDYKTWQSEITNPLNTRERDLLKRLDAVFELGARPVERKLAAWLIYEGIDSADYSDMRFTQDSEKEIELDLKQVDNVLDTVESLYRLCMRDEERIFSLQLGLEVLMTFSSIPSLAPWWEKLSPYAESIEQFEHESVTFHQCLAELLNLRAQYALIDQDLDEAHRQHRALKKAGYTYTGDKRTGYLEQWSHVSLMLTEIYAHRQNLRNARLLYEDICFIDEELAMGNTYVREDHAKGAELLIWLSRENPSNPKTLSLQRDLYQLSEENVTNSVMVRHFINGAISMAQSYGNGNQLQPALRLWELSHKFVRDGGHYAHPEVLMLLGKLGMNVIWAHSGREDTDGVQGVYDALCEMAGTSKGHPIQFFEQCAWAGVNLAWVYAQRGQLENLPNILRDIHVFEAHYPMVFGFKEAAAATSRNGLWGMRKTFNLKHDLVYQCIHHEAKRLVFEGLEEASDTSTAMCSPYYLQQLSTLLFQLGQLDIRTKDYAGFAERLSWAERLVDFRDTMNPEHALFICEFALIGLENRNNPELVSEAARFWNVLTTLATHFESTEEIQRLFAGGACHWVWELKRKGEFEQMEDLLMEFTMIHQKFPDNVEVIRGLCGIYATLVAAYADNDQWNVAKTHVEPFEILFATSNKDEKILHAWAEVLTKIITSWPHHRDISATMPYLEQLLALTKEHPHHSFWPSVLSQVRAHHCQSFYMLKESDLANAELGSLDVLWQTFKPHQIVEKSLMKAKAARIMWHCSQDDLEQCHAETIKLFQHHDVQHRERRQIVGWKHTLTAALAVFELAISQHDHEVADTIFRKSLALVQSMPQRSDDPWRSLGYMALGWSKHIPREADPRPWFKKVLNSSVHQVLEDLLHLPQTQGIAVWEAMRHPDITQTLNQERLIVGVLTDGNRLNPQTREALERDPDPLWIQQKCFEVCVLQGSQEAEDFYQKVKALHEG